MEEHKLTELLRLKSAEVPAKTHFCPDDELIAKYFEGTLAEQLRASLKQHLVDCRFCQARLGNLQRLATDDQDGYVPGSLLADAKRLVAPVLPTRTRYTTAWAAAAVVVLTLSTINMLGPRMEQDPVNTRPEIQPTTGNSRQLRSIDPAGLAPRIIAPAEGASIKADDLTIRWTEVSGSLYYNVRVVTAEGFLVLNDRVESTEWKLPAKHLLEPKTYYYVRVDAYMAEANSVSSDHILFTVEERQR